MIPFPSKFNFKTIHYMYKKAVFFLLQSILFVIVYAPDFLFKNIEKIGLIMSKEVRFYLFQLFLFIIVIILVSFIGITALASLRDLEEGLTLEIRELKRVGIALLDALRNPLEVGAEDPPTPGHDFGRGSSNSSSILYDTHINDHANELNDRVGGCFLWLLAMLKNLSWATIKAFTAAFKLFYALNTILITYIILILVLTAIEVLQFILAFIQLFIGIFYLLVGGFSRVENLFDYTFINVFTTLSSLWKAWSPPSLWKVWCDRWFEGVRRNNPPDVDLGRGEIGNERENLTGTLSEVGEEVVQGGRLPPPSL